MSDSYSPKLCQESEHPCHPNQEPVLAEILLGRGNRPRRTSHYLSLIYTHQQSHQACTRIYILYKTKIFLFFLSFLIPSGFHQILPSDCSVSPSVQFLSTAYFQAQITVELPLPCISLSFPSWFGIYRLFSVMVLTLLDFLANMSKP